MTMLSREMVFLILQFLEEDVKFKETARRIEQESGFYFNFEYFEGEILKGNWDEVEKYLSGFTKIEDNSYSTKTFFRIRKHKYLEALDEHDWTKARNILAKDLNAAVFASLDRKLFEDLAQLLPLDNYRVHGKFLHFLDAKWNREVMVIGLKKLFEENPIFRDKMQFPDIENSRLRTLIDQSLSWQHHLCRSPNPNMPDIKTLFVNHTCEQSNDAPAPSPSNNDVKPIQPALASEDPASLASFLALPLYSEPTPETSRTRGNSDEVHVAGSSNSDEQPQS